jgi:hypothetical protein
MFEIGLSISVECHRDRAARYDQHSIEPAYRCYDFHCHCDILEGAWCAAGVTEHEGVSYSGLSRDRQGGELAGATQGEVSPARLVMRLPYVPPSSALHRRFWRLDVPRDRAAITRFGAFFPLKHLSILSLP